MASCVWPCAWSCALWLWSCVGSVQPGSVQSASFACAWSCALWPVGESNRESSGHFSAKTRPYWQKRAVIRHTPRRENLIYALLVAVVVRGVRAGRVRAILLLRRMSVVVRLVAVVVRRVRAGRVGAGLLLLVLGIVRM